MWAAASPLSLTTGGMSSTMTISAGAVVSTSATRWLAGVISLLESWLGSGAAMAGRAMLAAMRRKCLICVVAMFVEERLLWNNSGDVVLSMSKGIETIWVDGRPFNVYICSFGKKCSITYTVSSFAFLSYWVSIFYSATVNLAGESGI